MDYNFHETTKKYLDSLNSFESQRKLWLRVSGFVCVAVLIIIYNWDKIASHFTLWVLSSLGFIISVSWWYWTMRLIRMNIAYKRAEAQQIDEIATEIKKLRPDIKSYSKGYKSD